MSPKENQDDYIERKVRETTVYQAIELGLLHTLDEDIEDTEDEETRGKLVKFKEGLFQNTGVRGDEVYRVIVQHKNPDGSLFPKTTYAKMETVAELLKRDNGLEFMMEQIRKASEKNEQEVEAPELD